MEVGRNCGLTSHFCDGWVTWRYSLRAHHPTVSTGCMTEELATIGKKASRISTAMSSYGRHPHLRLRSSRTHQSNEWHLPFDRTTSQLGLKAVG